MIKITNLPDDKNVQPMIGTRAPKQDYDQKIDSVHFYMKIQDTLTKLSHQYMENTEYLDISFFPKE